MAQNFENLFGHIEPVHYKTFKIYDYLRELYRFFHDKYQTQIDKAFDNVAKNVGFIITTTLPIQVEITKDGINVSIREEQFNDTIFEREFQSIFKLPKDKQISQIPEGKYNMSFIWYSALKLKMRTHWMEPVHHPSMTDTPPSRTPVKMDVIEPAHWFDPNIAIDQEDAMQISLIDEVYPDLKLADRIIATREAGRKNVSPGS